MKLMELCSRRCLACAIVQTITYRQWVPLNFGQQLAVIVGDPIDMSDLVEEYRRGETPDRYAITASPGSFGFSKCAALADNTA